MLALNSQNWISLSTFFGKPEELPVRILAWQQAIGTEDEESRWSELFEMFLHQFSITDAAYAVAPYVVEQFERISHQRWIEYLVTLGLIEAERDNRKLGDLGDDIPATYRTSLLKTRQYAIGCLAFDLPKLEFRYLLSVIANLNGHKKLGQLLFDLDCLCGKCPNCGKVVYPDDIPQSGYVA